MKTTNYQTGGGVTGPGPARKTPIMDGGRKPRLRDMITPEERRELDAPLTAEEVRRMSERMKKGGAVKKMASGGVTRGDGCATRGKTKGRMV